MAACDIVASRVLAASARARIDRPRAMRVRLMRRPKGVAVGCRGVVMGRVYVTACERLHGRVNAFRLRTMPVKARPAAEHFWSRVEIVDGGCWLWRGSTLRGYGTFSSRGRSLYAHRFSYELARGPIPAGMCVCHRCDNPPCANPEHLFLGTHSDNAADKFAKGRVPKGDQHWSRRIIDRRAVGERNGMVKLTDDRVREIRSSAASGEMQRSIARRLGVSEASVSLILSGKTWKHVVAETTTEIEV